MLGKVADFGERKQNCSFSSLVEEGKTFISKFSVIVSYQNDVGLE